MCPCGSTPNSFALFKASEGAWSKDNAKVQPHSRRPYLPHSKRPSLPPRPFKVEGLGNSIQALRGYTLLSSLLHLLPPLSCFSLDSVAHCHPLGVRIIYYLHGWKRITSDRVLQIVPHGDDIPFLSEPLHAYSTYLRAAVRRPFALFMAGIQGSFGQRSHREGPSFGNRDLDITPTISWCRRRQELFITF